MGITANSGPFVGYGQTTTSNGAVTEYNEERGPSLFDLSFGMADPRPAYNYDPGSAIGTKVIGLFDNIGFVDFVPTALSSNLLAISSNTTPSAGAVITLISSKTGVTQTTIIAPETLQASSNVLCLDSTAATLAFGQSGSVNTWNPAAGTGRCIVISPSSNLDAGSFTIAGRDMYGYKMTETVAAGSTTITSQKAFKYIGSITASTTITSTGIGVGTTDIYGFPIKLAYCGLGVAVRINASVWSSAVTVAFSSANVVIASTVATQTSTTPDVRGTYASTTASNGTVRMQMYQNITANMVNSVTNSDFSSIFGGTQYSSI